MFKSKLVQGIEFPGLNFALFIIGMVIVWLSCHNLLAMIGAFIAALHVRIAIKNNEKTYDKSPREVKNS